MNIKINLNDLKRNGYIRVYATNVDYWADFVGYCYYIFGVVPTEDNTVGQLGMEKSIKNNNTCNGGLNLYGLPIKPIKARVLEEIIKGTIVVS